jgi:agmatinase
VMSIRESDFIHFGGIEVDPTDFDEARIIVLPLCYEQAPSYGSGSHEGPYHILKASEQLESLDEETLINWSKIPIHTLAPMFPEGNPEEAVMEMKKASERALKAGKFLLSLGGDHAITIGPVMAAKEIYPQIGVLQIDAHTDLRQEWNGSSYNHACVMRRLADDVKIPFVQVGIRSFSPEEAQLIRKRGYTPVYAHEISPFDYSWIDLVVEALPEMVYLTLDLDGLDPSVIPGTGTPEPGGLLYRQVVNLIKRVGSDRKVVAADINELVKIKGSQVSEYTAAKLASKIIVYCVNS